MLTVRPEILQKVRSATCAADLHIHLQAAIELEHATIPPYLTALYSIKLGFNVEAAEIIRSVVIEEMLHLTIAANVLNAIGGKPRIHFAKFIPDYPSPLPMDVDDGLIVGLAAVSKDVVHDVFMRIEEPEDPLEFPVAEAVGEGGPYPTIGAFYQAIIQKIQELGEGIFTGDPARQVVDNTWFSKEELFPIDSVETATNALNIIIEQGEGTPKSPVDPEGDLAHYYRFAEIYHGRRLVKDPSVPEGYSYSGAKVPLDAAGIWDIVDNSKADMYDEGSGARRLVDQFNFSYTNLLNVLQETFNGSPERLNSAFGLMFEVRLQAQKMMAQTYQPLGKQVAPSFQFATLND